MKTSNRKVIAGVEFEAVRVMSPIPHWRPRVVSTGYLFSAGVFKSSTINKMFDDIERIAHYVGEKRFKAEALENKYECFNGDQCSKLPPSTCDEKCVRLEHFHKAKGE